MLDNQPSKVRWKLCSRMKTELSYWHESDQMLEIVHSRSSWRQCRGNTNFILGTNVKHTLLWNGVRKSIQYTWNKWIIIPPALFLSHSESDNHNITWWNNHHSLETDQNPQCSYHTQLFITANKYSNTIKNCELSFVATQEFSVELKNSKWSHCNDYNTNNRKLFTSRHEQCTSSKV